MPVFRLIAAVSLVAAIAAPATAAAAKRPDRASTAQALLTRAATVAQAHWGAEPCGGQLRILGRRALPAGAEPGTTAWVTFGSALGPNDLAADPAGYTRCTVSFARARWPTARSMAADWDLLCMTMTHEIGHLLGHAHGAGLAGIMAQVFSDYAAEPPACRTARPS